MPDQIPKPTDSDADEAQQRLNEQADERLDELDEAAQEAAENVEEPSEEDPFDGTESVDLDLADLNVGEESDEDEAVAGETATAVTEDDEMPLGGGGFAGAAGDAMSGADELEDSELASIIVEGTARAAVIGLDDEYKMSTDDDTDALEHEFREVFERFRLGKFGAEAAEEYVFVESDDIDPLWGFLGALTLCSIIVVSQRPDGDELVAKVQGGASGIGDKVSDLDLNT